MNKLNNSVKRFSFNVFFLFLPIVAALGSVNISYAASKFETWTEKTRCGESMFVLESVCKKSNDDFTLNECKSQTLSIQHDKRDKKVKLPELNAFSTRIVKEVGGDINNLFVTRWACIRSDRTNVMVLRYSTGGGSAPYSESEAVYDEKGNLLEEKYDPRGKSALIDTDRKLKPVRSIMPE